MFAFGIKNSCFNPCFNGSMYKNWHEIVYEADKALVSILVLMDLCIKTEFDLAYGENNDAFQSLF